MDIKTRKVKQYEYDEKYSHIPIDYNKRLEWMFDHYNLSEKKCKEIIDKRYNMINSLFYYDFKIILLEEPEGAKRPRFRIINRKNFANQAILNPQFVHVYSPQAREDNLYMKRLTDTELNELETLIHTPCIVEYCAYHKIPKTFNIVDKFLCEIGLIRPMIKPDWDNIGKKYSDMSNHNIWLDDSFVIDGTVRKFYSVLPRIEIHIRYLNMLYNKYQYDTISKRKDYGEFSCNATYFKGE